MARRCPNCVGTGIVYGLIPPNHVTCEICNGTGKLPKDVRYDPQEGRRMKKSRLAWNMTLRYRAHIMGIDAEELSRMERGYFRRTYGKP